HYPHLPLFDIWLKTLPHNDANQWRETLEHETSHYHQTLNEAPNVEKPPRCFASTAFACYVFFVLHSYFQRLV
ncbi:MAG: hypothetical protein ACE5HI_17990, partial [bacterium]